MMRTTISLHESVLEKTRKEAKRNHRSLGETISELLTLGLEKKLRRSKNGRKPFVLGTYAMGFPRVSLEDKDALRAVLDSGKI
jgi:hypothetical protein